MDECKPLLCGFIGAVFDEDGEETPGGGESKKCNCKKSKVRRCRLTLSSPC